MLTYVFETNYKYICSNNTYPIKYMNTNRIPKKGLDYHI